MSLDVCVSNDVKVDTRLSLWQRINTENAGRR